MQYHQPCDIICKMESVITKTTYINNYINGHKIFQILWEQILNRKN